MLLWRTISLNKQCCNSYKYFVTLHALIKPVLDNSQSITSSLDLLIACDCSSFQVPFGIENNTIAPSSSVEL